MKNRCKLTKRDIPMSETQFGFALGVFYVSYVLAQLPANILLEIFKPKRWIAIVSASWGYAFLIYFCYLFVS